MMAAMSSIDCIAVLKALREPNRPRLAGLLPKQAAPAFATPFRAPRFRCIQ